MFSEFLYPPFTVGNVGHLYSWVGHMGVWLSEGSSGAAQMGVGYWVPFSVDVPLLFAQWVATSIVAAVCYILFRSD